MQDKKHERVTLEKSKAKIVQRLSESDYARLELQQQYQDMDMASARAKVFLQADTLRMNRDKAMMQIDTMLTDIKGIHDRVKRYNAQLDIGNITVQISDGVTMDTGELKTLLQRELDTAWAISRDLINPLRDLAGVVGHIDITKNVIMTDDQYNLYVKGIETQLSKWNYKLFNFDDNVNVSQ